MTDMILDAEAVENCRQGGIGLETGQEVVTEVADVEIDHGAEKPAAAVQGAEDEATADPIQDQVVTADTDPLPVQAGHHHHQEEVKVEDLGIQELVQDPQKGQEVVGAVEAPATVEVEALRLVQEAKVLLGWLSENPYRNFDQILLYLPISQVSNTMQTRWCSQSNLLMHDLSSSRKQDGTIPTD